MHFKLFILIALFPIFAIANTNAIHRISNDTITKAEIDVEYKAKDTTGLNWNNELELARVISTLDGKGIRITLPNADPAKVIILDKNGKKKLKSVLYVAPAIIDISKFRNGNYQLILQLHNVVAVKMFKKVPAKKK